ncbi:unnamed protein product [Protopolystoma xenopodis]|uniref:Tubulin-specific chaperone E n=1 Tax=Protopolystoma xenopodis TaxID=117903 RepID=A0A3S4ZY62_9PLAT|nr:unnamed protein product [Protopolystoma xenopodis]
MTDIYNIFAGTKCGEITDPSEELIGKRVTNDDYLGTIKYVGPLPGSKSFWLGIDWDNETRGRHSGIFNGVQYFLTTFPTSGSFVRSSKVSLGCSFEEALVYRYSTCAECQLLARNNEPIKMDVTLRQEKVDASAVEKNSGFITLKPAIQLEEAEYEGPNADFISPFHLELFSRPIKDADRHAFCGFAGAEKILTKLRSVTLSQVPVYRALYHTQAAVKESAPPLWPLTGGILGNLLPKLTELDISASTFSRWIDVAELCIQLPWLQSLNVSHNPLRISLDSVSMLPGPSSFPEEVACSFNPQKDCDDTHKLLDPRLHTDILPSQEAAARAEALMHHAFPSVRRLAMVCVKHVNWIRLDRILSWFPALDDLVVAYNPVSHNWILR